ncbi:MAG TPA: type II toxin-antitoxin system Phd/YefM family antitoxin [Candidatus Eisenbergiella pullistercoris]|uniref:Antitoxin n=1 Tax=Candidatus Eisenbergiella pullistercoris TaxID=2838555 RepID=A0A9D1YRK3_9FIRM|nr:type II toxin-antitoxin system Phd/YefM family antitoxin [Candidatus Eisenbergiella pullistercoris]
MPIAQFNKGQAAKIFDRLRSEPELIVLKNNQPSAVILAPDEYIRLAEIEEDYNLLIDAGRRLAANKDKAAIPAAEVMKHFGISEADLEEVEEPEIE